MGCEILYQNQTKAIIKMDVEEDITGSVAKIQWRKPSGAIGFFPGSITNQVLGLFQYQILSANDLDEFGDYTFWADIIYADGKQIFGDPKVVKIPAPGQV